MQQRFFKLLILTSIILVQSFNFANGGRIAKRSSTLQSFLKPTVQNQFTMTGNNWAFEMTNYGPYAQDIAGRLPTGGGSGGEFPRGTGTYIIFAAGLQIGAMVDGIPKVSVIDFDSEYQPGAVGTNAGAADNKLFALYKDGSDGTPPGNGDDIDDYLNWPKQYGAPVDNVGNPLVIGDLMSWCVYNDMDTSLHRLPDDSQKDPLGLEVQQASIQVNITGYSDVFFMYWKIINKGTKNLSDVYISGWFDPDVDKASNDLIATDTLTSMAFTYNADNTDPVSLGGSAFGADFSQGPVVDGEPTDTAKYLELTIGGFVQRIVPGKKVLGLSSTVRYINVRGAEGDPDNDRELYNLMRGLEKNGDPKSSRFTYPADPLTAPSSELDPRPDDKRMMLCTGPFNLAVGDTQVVILSCVGGKGTDRLDAIKNLRATDTIAQRLYDQGFHYPKCSIYTRATSSTTTEITTVVDLTDFQSASSAKLHFTPEYGTESDFYIALYDDGLHQDKIAGDNIWGNTQQRENRKYPYKGDLIVQYTGPTDTFNGAYSRIAIRPLPLLDNWRVIWENGQQDKKVNNYERVHLTFDIENPDQVNDISEISITCVQNTTPLNSNTIIPGGTFSDTSFYLILTAPASGDSFKFAYTINFDNHFKMMYSDVPIINWNPGTLWGDTLQVIPIQGKADYLIPIIADPMLLNGHTYAISFYKDINTNLTVFQIKDSTTDVVKLTNSPISPDELYPHPVIDGILWKMDAPEPDFSNFEVVANAGGSLIPSEGAAADFTNFPSKRPTDSQQVGPARWLIHTADNGYRPDYQSFLYRTTRGGPLWTEIIPYDFEIRFTATGSWAYDSYNSMTNFFHVPFELWNIGIGTPDDITDDYRMVPWLLDDDSSVTFNMGVPNAKFAGTYDHTVSGGDNDPYTDWIYWQRPANTSPGQSGYLAAEAEMIAGTYDGNRETEVMARMVFVNWNGDIGATPPSGTYNQPLPENGTIFRITTTKPNMPGDLLIVNSIIVDVLEDKLPITFSLHQNYPNPFNPITKIEYSLPVVSRVKLTIYNVLGQEVIKLVDEIQDPGVKIVRWNSFNNYGGSVASGVYFYRLEATSINQPSKSFTQVRKMLLLR
ncbi:MAG: T9SS type A sorting domain-containing protein [Bacteroidota bacterium]|nr:T9SS type A sorting domain-containing protein [Bacteroidota bacterium]